MVTEIKLGLCNPPEPIYLFVNQGEVDGESYVWYKFNINQDKKIPVAQRALTGYLSELRLTTKEFKGKDNLKLDEELTMKVIVTVVEKITSEAHIDIPDGLNQSAIKQHIVDRYNTGEMSTDMNIFQVDFESISARIVQGQADTNSISSEKEVIR